MKSKVLLATITVMLLLGAQALASGIKDLSIYGSTRFETHDRDNSIAADNLFQTTFTFITNTGYRSSAIASVGHRMDVEDNESDNLALSLAYIHSFSKSSYMLSSYSNFRSYESIDDGRLENSTDMFNFIHGWKVVKRDRLRLTLFTSLSTDTAFDDNRMIGETFSFSGPVGKKYRWGISYQYGYSLVSDDHSINTWDLKIAMPVSRKSTVSLTRRMVDYLNPGGTDINDNTWLLSYSYRIR